MKRRYKKLRELQAAFKKKKKKQTSLHIIVKPLKNTDKEKIMKEGGKKDIDSLHTKVRITVDFSSEIMKNRRQSNGILKDRK